MSIICFSRVYIPCIYLLNKIDQISIEVSISTDFFSMATSHDYSLVRRTINFDLIPVVQSLFGANPSSVEMYSLF